MSAFAGVGYYFEIVVPPKTNVMPSIIPITIDVSASGRTSVSDYTGSSAYAQIAISQAFGTYGGVLNYEAVSGIQGSGYALPPIFTLNNKPVNIYANEVYSVNLTAEAIASIYGTVAKGNADASVDPFIGIDPSTLALYPNAQLFLSPGVQQSNPSATPLPSSWTMMMLGLAGLGYLAYRRNKSGTALRSF